jgi:hypothetical protein
MLAFRVDLTAILGEIAYAAGVAVGWLLRGRSR